MTEVTQPPPTQPHDTAIKETIEAIVAAFILAFVFRAFVVEAFVIPTGSMAPTLLGQHVRFTCPQCGYHFKSGPRDQSAVDRRTAATFQGRQPVMNVRPDDGALTKLIRTIGFWWNPQWVGEALEINCPMCEFPIVEPVQRTRAGDRILVLKYIYKFSEPRRWDVVVFRNPVDPRDNYIKRLVGLPNEWLWIVRGNIFTSRDEGQTWQIQRKPLRVQEEVWQPVYRSRYVPLDHGQAGEMRRGPWQSPWRVEAGTLKPTHEGMSYDYQPDGGEGRLNFTFSQRTGGDYYPYNDLGTHGSRTTSYVEELRVGVSVNPSGTGGAVTLRMNTELADAEAGIDADSRPFVRYRRRDTDDWHIFTGEPVPLPVNHSTRVELWHADQSVQLWIDDQLIHAFDYDVSIQPLREMGEPSGPPTVGVEVSGAPMSLSRVNLDRDLYYTQNPYSMRTPQALATHDRIARIGADEFFCLGDNSPSSQDGRFWDSVNDWITYHTPEHTHLALNGTEVPGVAPGLVPRKLMIGRAFFVYWPAPFGLSATFKGLIPNFGDLRFIE